MKRYFSGLTTLLLLVLYKPELAEADSASDWMGKLKTRAEMGDASAETYLGSKYFKGDVVPKNEVEAVSLWRKAAAQNYAPAETLLGNAYFSGSGVSKDESEAVKWWRQAADHGDADGEALLGQAYYGEIGGLQKDKEKAFQLLRKSKEDGSGVGTTFLKVLETFDKPD